MKLRQTTREIIHSVEDISGIHVQVTEDPKLKTIASVRMARDCIESQDGLGQLFLVLDLIM